MKEIADGEAVAFDPESLAQVDALINDYPRVSARYSDRLRSIMNEWAYIIIHVTYRSGIRGMLSNEKLLKIRIIRNIRRIKFVLVNLKELHEISNAFLRLCGFIFFFSLDGPLVQI